MIQYKRLTITHTNDLRYNDREFEEEVNRFIKANFWGKNANHGNSEYGIINVTITEANGATFTQIHFWYS